jgi:hydroxyacylglutathione hydrolase
LKTNIESNCLIDQIRVGNFKNFSYLVGDPNSKEAAVFDPAWELSKILNLLKINSLHLKFIINTHSHMDHIEGNTELQNLTGARIVMSFKSLAKKDIGVKDDQELILGNNVRLRFLVTPGHSPDSMCIQVNDIAVMTGDTLFIGECGRVDLPGGDASDLYESFERIRRLDPKLIVYPGHDYGLKPSSTLKEQLENNYTLVKREKQDFIRFMNEP